MVERSDLIGEFTNHTIDQALIRHLEKHHSDLSSRNEAEEHDEEELDGDSEEEDSLDQLEGQHWRFLAHEHARCELLARMMKRLELSVEFVGNLCDDVLIAHLVKHHL